MITLLLALTTLAAILQLATAARQTVHSQSLGVGPRLLQGITPGRVIAWGLDEDGQASVPSSIPSSNVQAIAGGWLHSLAIVPGGKVVAWGDNSGNQATVPLEALSGVVGICGGSNHSLALKGDGSVVAWGQNDQEQTKVPSAAQAGVIAVACGDYHSLGLLSNGAVVAWGRYQEAQIAVPTAALSSVKAIEAGGLFSLALLANGTVVAWGKWNDGAPVTVPAYAKQNVKAIAAHGDNVMALLNSGSVVTFGRNDLVPLAARANVTAIAAGWIHYMALLEDETMVSWGANMFGQITPVYLAQAGVQAISAGGFHSLAIVNPAAQPVFTPLRQDANPGRVIAWGLDRDGQATVPSSLSSDVQAIACGAFHSLALDTGGKVVAWGDNSNNKSTVPLEALSDVVDICAGTEHSLALKSNGSVVAWGQNVFQQTNIPSTAQAGVIAIACGDYHNVGLLATGAVVAWGHNKLGENGVDPSALSGVKAITAGEQFTLALLANGTVIGWGAINGTPVTTMPSYAQQNVKAISAGRTNFLTLLNDGTVVSSIGDDQVPLAARTNVTAIAAGDLHWMALRNGTVISWGNNLVGQATPILLAQAGVQAIAAGRAHSLAIVSSGPASAVPPPPPPVLVTPTPAPPASAVPRPPAPVLVTPTPAPPASAVPPTRLPPSPPLLVVSTPVPTDAESSSGAPVGAIVGGIVGGVVVLVLLVVGIWLLRRRALARNPPLIARTKSQASDELGDGVAVLGMGAKPFVSIPTSGMSKQSAGTSPLSTATTLTTPSSVSKPSRMSSSQTGIMTPSSTDQQMSDANITEVIQMRMLDSLLIRWSDLTVGRMLGAGGFGQVYQGVWQGLPVAIKTLDLDKLGAGSREALHQEALIMCDLRYPYIVRVLGLVDDGEHHALVMQLHKRGTLTNLMAHHSYEDRDINQRLKLALQVAMGMRFLHSRAILHGDLKASNVLVSDDGKTIAIADFGLSGKLFGDLGTIVESGALTVSISPPEVLMDPVAPRTAAADVYMFGILLLEILVGRSAYPRDMRKQMIVHAVLDGHRPNIPDDRVPANVASIITACWAQDPQARPSFAQVASWLEAVLPRFQAVLPDVGEAVVDHTTGTWQ